MQLRSLATNRTPVVELEGVHIYARYVSYIEEGGRSLFVMKDHVAETSMVAWADGEFRPFRAWPRMRHNLALCSANETHFLALGGLFLNGSSVDTGVAASFSSDLVSWTRPLTVLLGSHEGCVECRPAWNSFRTRNFNGQCEFDGRLSVVRFQGRFWAYARANTGVGKRHVQVTRSVDGLRWGPFRMLKIDQDTENIYFFAVTPHPLLPGTLLALYPYAERGAGVVAAAVSVDGYRWRHLGALLEGGALRGRSLHHPVSGVAIRKEQVAFFVHEDVHYENRDYLTLTHNGLRQIAPGWAVSAVDAAFSLFLPTSRIAQHAIASDHLVRATRAALNRTGPFHHAKCLGAETAVPPFDARPALLIGGALASAAVVLARCARLRPL